MTIQQANRIPLVFLMKYLGYYPAKTAKGGEDIWYISPFREESTPSFHIHANRNVWYDFGETKGGRVVDFIQHYKKCDCKTALAFLDRLNYRAKRSGEALEQIQELGPDLVDKKKMEAVEIKPLKNKSLIAYLIQRRINTRIARKYVQEIHYRVGEKHYYGLAMDNVSGGYEIRNPYFKGVFGKKNFSLLRGNTQENLLVFEGLMDFLSYLTHNQLDTLLEEDVLILYSLTSLPKALKWLSQQSYQCIYTFLDNDPSGEKATTEFVQLGPHIQPCNVVYFPHKDYNEFLLHL